MAMKRIFLTLRSDPARNGAETRDAIDKALTDFLLGLGYTVILVPNDPANAKRLLSALPPDGVVLSGGNDVDPALYSKGGRHKGVNVDPRRDRTELELVAYCRRRKLPLIGVCRGQQLLNVALGGTLSHTLGEGDGRSSHEAVSHPVRLSDRFPLAAWRGRRVKVNSFHNHGVARENLFPGAISLAESPDGVIEALRHPRLPLFAVQWHPERKGSPAALDKALFRHVLGKASR